MTESNVFKLSQPGTFSDPLTEVLRSGARSLLAHAIEAEVAAFLGNHADKLTEDGRRRLVRHGHHLIEARHFSHFYRSYVQRMRQRVPQCHASHELVFEIARAVGLVAVFKGRR